jgi:predicted transposase/invertase (TIGR01784 family)
MSERMYLSDDEGSRRAAFVRERALIEERSALKAAKREGRGEGRQEGRQEAQIETAQKMIAANRFDDATIAEFSGLSEEEVRRLRVQA